jgi:3D (Asp-Asp-Asp) domain-containing protein
VAEDTGGAIKGRIIDLFFNSEQEAINWGRRNVTIKILKY